jgi:hypothetical protein
MTGGKRINWVWLAKTLGCSIGAAKAQYRMQHMTSEQLQRSRDQAKADAPHKCAGTRCRPLRNLAVRNRSRWTVRALLA